MDSRLRGNDGVGVLRELPFDRLRANGGDKGIGVRRRFEGADFRFLIPLRFIRNDRC